MRERPLIAVYMMSNRKHGTIYTGVTANLFKRGWEHRNGLIDGFTKKYGLKRLVWYEQHASMVEAIRRESTLKKYKREWKINLIERENPDWADLYPSLMRGQTTDYSQPRCSWVAGTPYASLRAARP